MIPGDLLSTCPHRQFHTLPGLLDSWAVLPNSYPNSLRAMQGGSLYHFYDGLWYDPAERRTHDLPCERRTRYRLSQPDTIWLVLSELRYSPGYITQKLPCRVGSVSSMSASRTVGREFASRPGHTKDHHKNGTNCLPA